LEDVLLVVHIIVVLACNVTVDFIVTCLASFSY